MRRLVLVLTASCLVMTPRPVRWWSSRVEWPVDRVAKNLDAYVAEHPDDANAHYVLGRVHGRAFVLGSGTIGVYENGERKETSELGIEEVLAHLKETFDPGTSQRFLASDPIDERARLAHLAAASEHLRRALELAPGRGDYQLGFAYILEQGAPFAARVDTLAILGLHPSPPLSEDGARIAAWLNGESPVEAEPAFGLDELERALTLLVAARDGTDEARSRRAANLLERYWLERAIAAYELGHRLAFAQDRTLERLPMARPGVESELQMLVSYEAGTAYVRLVQQRGAHDESERTRVAEIQANLAALGKIPPCGMITPIVLALDDCRTLDELVTPKLNVPFDLDGDGIDELWPWLAPDAGWLVWDPHHRGEITSGQQLFGSASGWLFFEDGYRLLDALDDDRNGKLEGAELDGIAVWFDRNTNGISDRGEVVPVAKLGIVALSTRSTLTLGASPANLCGAELADGRVLPTYDWVLAPAVAP